MLIPGSLTRFRDPADYPNQNPILARYIEPLIVPVPGKAPGESVTVRMRAWPVAAGSFEVAPYLLRGDSLDLLIPQLGSDQANAAILPPSFTGFMLPLPEPSVSVVSFLGALLLWPITTKMIPVRPK